MSMEYSIDVTLGISYNTLNIQKILERGTSIGFIYFDQNIDQNIFYADAPIITSEQATQKVMIALEKDLDYGPAVYTKIQDTYVYMAFYKDSKNNINIYFSKNGYAWKNDWAETGVDEDVIRYTRVFLQLIDLFRITKLEITYM